MHPDLPVFFDGNPVNGALWTIKVEIGFYIILPLINYLLQLMKSKKGQNILLISIYVLSVLWNLLLSKFSSALHLPSQLSYQLPGFMSFFVCGMAFVINWEYLTSKLNILVIPAVLCFILYFILKTEIIFPLALTICVMFAVLKFTFFRNIGRPVDYSYGMYLYHFPLINILTALGFFEKRYNSKFCLSSFDFFFYHLYNRKFFYKKI